MSHRHQPQYISPGISLFKGDFERLIIQAAGLASRKNIILRALPSAIAREQALRLSLAAELGHFATQLSGAGRGSHSAMAKRPNPAA